jgi:hypothetical protein
MLHPWLHGFKRKLGGVWMIVRSPGVQNSVLRNHGCSGLWNDPLVAQGLMMDELTHSWIFPSWTAAGVKWMMSMDGVLTRWMPSYSIVTAP